ncbi:MAG: 3-phosphoshikimate 1-carboxyvinyltransferase [Planctomycetes bacterium]|nr:3-phosphoshikimate 1-carboxyvinyltransferase [Planctomycetota bacterium]
MNQGADSTPDSLLPLLVDVEQLPARLAIPTPLPGHRFNASIRPPGSKSLTNRALLLAALAQGESTLRRPLVDADDARQMIRAIQTLGANVELSANSLRVRGVAGRWNVPSQGVTLNLNNAGTAVRFLAGAALLAPAPVTIDGNARMRQRPIGELGDLLRTMGARVEYPAADRCPPVRIIPPISPPLTTLEIGPTQSSQFISALLLAAPCLPHGLTLRLTGSPTSASYISMTLGLLAKLGATVRTSNDQRVIRVLPTPPALPAFDYAVEPDASGATYFWSAAALIPGAVCTISDLSTHSLQGDAQFPTLLARMGASVESLPRTAPGIAVTGPASLAPIIADMADMPDAAMTIACVAAFAIGQSILRGLATLRVKETDRIAALQTELAKIGVTAAVHADDPNALIITPPPGGVDCSTNAPPVYFDTYDDHRMAMSLALIGLRRPNVFINNPACVAKTYPTFFQDLAKVLSPRS